MGDKGHFLISMAKSLIRLVGCLVTVITGNVITLAASLGLAELLGVAEEFADKRK